MQFNAIGALSLSSGLPLMCNAGTIDIPSADKVEIGTDGTISFRAQGEAPAVLAEVDRIKLVRPEQRMIKGADGLMRTEDGLAQPADGAVTLVTGFLEGSNVNAVEEMTAMLSLARQFELHVKMMRTAEENAQSTNKLLQIS